MKPLQYSDNIVGIQGFKIFLTKSLTHSNTDFQHVKYCLYIHETMIINSNIFKPIPIFSVYIVRTPLLILSKVYPACFSITYFHHLVIFVTTKSMTDRKPIGNVSSTRLLGKCITSHSTNKHQHLIICRY